MCGMPLGRPIGPENSTYIRNRFSGTVSPDGYTRATVVEDATCFAGTLTVATST